jgi:hypothetical protein
MRDVLVGLGQAAAVRVVYPAVVIAAQPALFDITIAEVGAAMPAMTIDQAVFAPRSL